eukprot:5226270-Amphidinium_carterae.1
MAVHGGHAFDRLQLELGLSPSGFTKSSPSWFNRQYWYVGWLYHEYHELILATILLSEPKKTMFSNPKLIANMFKITGKTLKH